MRTHLHRTAVVAAYQTSMTIGILLLPIAVALRRTFGVRLPLHRVIEPVLRAYEADSDESNREQ